MRVLQPPTAGGYEFLVLSVLTGKEATITVHMKR
jgi:hypothetical protein